MDFAWPSNVDIYKQPLVVNNSLHDIPSKALVFLTATVSTTVFGEDDGVMCAINSTHCLSFRDAFRLI